CFYPGGGGQPHDTGHLQLQNGHQYPVLTVHADADQILWHVSDASSNVKNGDAATLIVDAERRKAFARYHTVLHVLNTIALRDYKAWITGVQISVDYSRIDFKFEGFTPELRGEIEQKVNAVLVQNHPIRSYFLPETEFRARTDLLRTL